MFLWKLSGINPVISSDELEWYVVAENPDAACPPYEAKVTSIKRLQTVPKWELWDEGQRQAFMVHKMAQISKCDDSDCQIRRIVMPEPKKYIYVGPFEILRHKVYVGEHRSGDFFVCVDGCWVGASEDEWEQVDDR